MSVETLDSQTFDDFIAKADKVVFVDFSATWCGPCRMYGPIFHDFADQNADSVLCGSVDIDESRDIAMRYGINAVPTTLVFKAGEVVETFLGAIDGRTLASTLAKHS